MKQKILLKTMLLLCALVAGSTSVWGQTYEKASSIQEGDIVVFVTEDEGMELSGISTTSTKYGIGSSYTTTPVGTYPFTVVEGNSDGTFAFKNSNNDYLNWTSGNSLNVNSTLSSNTSWNVTFDSGNAILTNANTSARQIWWNHNSPRFACYTDKSAGDAYYSIQIYKQTSSSYTVSYNGNGNTGGTAPEDNNTYSSGATVTVLGNTGSLVKAGCAFGGWNTQADGEGTNYAAGATFTITANTILYAKWNPYSITAVSNDEDMGTVSGTTTITASPKSGYRVKAGIEGYTVTSGTAAVTNNGDNTFTVVPSTDCTVTINFEAIPAYTVTFSDGGFVTEAIGGAGVDLPTRSDKGDYEFAGWSETNVPTETTTVPTIIPAGSYNPTANITLYPVYTRTEGSAPTAFSVGSTGDFVIVAKVGDNYYALPTNPTVKSGKIDGEEITVSDYSGIKYVTPANATGYTWEIAAATYGYSISDGSKYIYHSNGGASGTNLAYGDDTNKTWAFTAQDGCIKMAGMSGSTTNNRGMLFNGTVFGGYALSNWGADGYYKTMILPVAVGGTTYYWSGTQTVNITAGFATFSAPYAIDFSATSLNVYTAAVSGDKVVLTSVPSKQVPANTGVVLEGTTSNGILIASASALADNELVAAAADNSSKGNGLTIYALGVGKDGDAKDKVGFYLVNNGQTIPAGKAYLEVPSPVKEFLTFSFEDDADGIKKTLSDSPLKGENIYNLAGQRLSKMQKGINIVNGKKILY